MQCLKCLVMFVHVKLIIELGHMQLIESMNSSLKLDVLSNYAMTRSSPIRWKSSQVHQWRVWRGVSPISRSTFHSDWISRSSSNAQFDSLACFVSTHRQQRKLTRKRTSDNYLRRRLYFERSSELAPFSSRLFLRRLLHLRECFFFFYFKWPPHSDHGARHVARTGVSTWLEITLFAWRTLRFKF